MARRSEAPPGLPEESQPLDPEQFSFYRFGALQSHEERRVRRLVIRHGEPITSTFDNAIFVPKAQSVSKGGGKFTGGLVTAAGDPIDDANLYRRGKQVGGHAGPVAVSARHEIDEPVVYLGVLFSHYGRLLLESLARIWALAAVDPAVKVVFHLSDAAEAAPESKMYRVLEAFGIPPSRILTFDTPTRLRRAIVPEALFEQLDSAHAGMIRPFRDVAERIAGGIEPSPQPVYLSRRLLKSRQRPVIGEAELEDVLRENGFLIAHPETMTFADQVRLVNAHTDIFAAVGSAAHSVLFALREPRLHLLATRDGIPANYFLCSALAGAPTTFINCLGAGRWEDHGVGRRGRQNRAADTPALSGGSQSVPQLVDMPAMVGYLDEQGYLGNRLRASFAGRDPRLQQEHDESWLYARGRKASSRAEPLPDDVLAAAEEMAASSWPVSLVLARYYARLGARERADAMAANFLEAVASEHNVHRLAHYHADVQGFTEQIMDMCSPTTADRLRAMLEDRFRISAPTRDAD